MLLTYENKGREIVAERKSSIHVPPHLHGAIEMIYVTDGSVELGVGQELYHMDKGDFAIIFPNVIHHYQVFESGKNKAIYLLAEPTVLMAYNDELQKYSPRYPVIGKEQLHTDIVNSMKSLVTIEDNDMLKRAYVQMILAHVFSEMKMVEKESVGGNDIIYNAIEYVAKNFRKEIKLDKMAYDLGVSKYVLSRMFAKTFHCNFNAYINGVRLNYAAAMLAGTRESIINIGMECGFESQRTFNRVFKERYKMTPGEYRCRISENTLVRELL